MNCLVDNPAWSSRVLAQIYEQLEDRAGDVPPQWLPRLADVRAHGKGISVHANEYGCGAYGCVYPTLDPHVVLKITADDTEAQFAAQIAPDLARPICVYYHRVLEPHGAVDQRGSQVYLLWRESAEHVGEIGDVLGQKAQDLVDAQHVAATAAYSAVRAIERGSGKIRQRERDAVREALHRWIGTCEAMARQIEIPELRPLGEGFVEVYETQNVLFGDVHAGNLGLVRRPDGDRWVITDPGHIAVVDLT